MNPVVLQANDCSGLRLDSFLGRELPELTRSAAQRLIEDGRVTVDGKTVSKSAKLSGGETVAVELPEPEPANAAAHQSLAAQLQDHSLARTYEAIVVGGLREDAGTVDAPIGRHFSDRKKMAVTQKGRPAATHWEVLERFPGFTHVRCRLETGRTHQIRVHMAYLGHPIWGDTVYGAKKPAPGLTGQCLQAVGLRFVHPVTGKPVELSCPLDAEFQKMLQKLRSL